MIDVWGVLRCLVSSTPATMGSLLAGEEQWLCLRGVACVAL